MHENPTALNGYISTGEKAKARDIITAIRVLQTVEREQRPPTDDEMQALRRFGGFGAVALSIFPDPSSGRFKDGWQVVVVEQVQSFAARIAGQGTGHQASLLRHRLMEGRPPEEHGAGGQPEDLAAFPFFPNPAGLPGHAN